MSVRIEFYGVPRHRAGVSAMELDQAATLGEAVRGIAARLPKLAAVCFDGDRLRRGYIANVNGERFTVDPQTPLRPGDAVLILSSDAGG